MVAGILMLCPLLMAFWTPWAEGCSGGSTQSMRLAIAGTVPFSVINHFGHAAKRGWVPVLQKLDRSAQLSSLRVFPRPLGPSCLMCRTFIAIASIAGAWAMSQNVSYTLGAVARHASPFALSVRTCAPRA